MKIRFSGFAVGLAWIALIPGGLFSGCAGYQLGPTNGLSAGSRTISFHPFKNDTLIPRLDVPVNNALRKRVQQDGTYQLVTQEEGDIVVSGTIVSFYRAGITTQPSDTLRFRDYRVTITAHVKATDQISGKVLLDGPVTGSSTMRVETDMPSSDRQVSPLLAEDLAINVVAILAEGDF